jgi:hypothetical protein
MPSGMRPAIDILPGNVASIYNFNPSFAADLFFASSPVITGFLPCAGPDRTEVPAVNKP